MIIPNNADKVVAAVEQQYGRPEYLIDAIVNLARDTRAPRENLLSLIINYANAISNLVTTVQTMGIHEYLNNLQLLKELVDKFPDSMKMQWGEAVIGMIGGPTPVDFSDRISRKAKAISAIAIPKYTLSAERGRKQLT